MSNYIVKYNETITDVTLNATGAVSGWETILQLNDLTDWTPELIVGQSLIVPDVIDRVFYNELQLYPACNYHEITNLITQINDLTDILDAVVPSVQSLPETTINSINKYVVKDGETITDVVLNATGSILNWEAVLEVNGFTDWLPILTVGQEIIIPAVELQTNVLVDLALYPACNRPDINNLDAQITNIINMLLPPSKIFEDGILFLFEDEKVYKYENGGPISNSVFTYVFPFNLS